VLNAALALKGQKASAPVKLHEFPQVGILWMYKINNSGGGRKGICQAMYSKIKKIFSTLFFFCPLLDIYISRTLTSTSKHQVVKSHTK